MGEITDSSLMAEGGKNACWVFAMMIAKADKDHCLRKDPRLFAKEIDVTQEEFSAAVDVLSKPDPYSNIPLEEGRRIIPLADKEDIEGNRGWFIVNREHYINKAQRSSKDRVAKHRHKEKILNHFNDLFQRNVTVTLTKPILYIYISISISISIINYLIENNIDLEAWALYEDYRKKVKNKALESDQGRKRQINILIGHPPEVQKEIIQYTIENEWIKLIPYQDIQRGKSNGSKPGKLQRAADAIKQHEANRVVPCDSAGDAPDAGEEHGILPGSGGVTPGG